MTSCENVIPILSLTILGAKDATLLGNLLKSGAFLGEIMTFGPKVHLLFLLKSVFILKFTPFLIFQALVYLPITFSFESAAF